MHPRARITSIFVVLVSLVATIAFAHMRVVKTTPEDGGTLSAAPEAIQVWYTQKPDAAVSKLTLRGPDGEVEIFVHPAEENSLMGMVQQEGLADGEYKVAWQAAGDDGHIQKGEFSFTLATP